MRKVAKKVCKLSLFSQLSAPIKSGVSSRNSDPASHSTGSFPPARHDDYCLEFSWREDFSSSSLIGSRRIVRDTRWPSFFVSFLQVNSKFTGVEIRTHELTLFITTGIIMVGFEGDHCVCSSHSTVLPTRPSTSSRPSVHSDYSS